MSDEDSLNEMEVTEQGGDIDRLREELDQVNQQLSQAEYEKALSLELTREGVIDLDAALKLAGSGDDVVGVVSDLKGQKPYLFAKTLGSVATVSLGVKSSNNRVNSQIKLEKAAEQARGSGSRKDLYEYLKLRRVMKR